MQGGTLFGCFAALIIKQTYWKRSKQRCKQDDPKVTLDWIESLPRSSRMVEMEALCGIEMLVHCVKLSKFASNFWLSARLSFTLLRPPLIGLFHSLQVVYNATTCSSDSTPRRPQFVSVFRPSDSMEKMQIPAKFVQSYIPKEHLNSQRAVVFGRLAKIGHIEVEMNLSGIFFASGWSEFLAFHGITNDNYLLLRYEGNMVFTLKVFEPDGFQREWKDKDIRFEPNMATERRYETPLVSIQKCNGKEIPSASSTKNKIKNDGIRYEKRKGSEGSQTSLNKLSTTIFAYDIGPPAWIKKEMNASTIQHQFSLPLSFCEAIGIWEPCMITLKTSTSSSMAWQVHAKLGWFTNEMDVLAVFATVLLQGDWDLEPCMITLKTSTSSSMAWQVHAVPYKKRVHVCRGWKTFCRENGIKVGDSCTFNIVETMMWHVDITR